MDAATEDNSEILDLFLLSQLLQWRKFDVVEAVVHHVCNRVGGGHDRGVVRQHNMALRGGENMDICHRFYF